MDPEELRAMLARLQAAPNYQGLLAQQDVTAFPAARRTEPAPTLLEQIRSGVDWLGMNTLGRGLALLTADPRLPETQRRYGEHLGVAADFVPGLGDIKALGYDAPRLFAEGHPIMGGLAAASALPLFGVPETVLRAMRARGQVVTARHYGPQVEDIDVLDPSRYGTGLRGAEARRKERFSDEWVDRTYAYLPGQRGQSPLPEPGLAGKPFTEFEVDLSRYADQRLWDDFQGRATAALQEEGLAPVGELVASRTERMLKEAGYEGYYTDDGMLAKFTPTPITARGQRFQQQIRAHMDQPEDSRGSTFSVEGENMMGRDAYSVAAFDGDDLVRPELTPEVMREFEDQYAEALAEPGRGIGTWERQRRMPVSSLAPLREPMTRPSRELLEDIRANGIRQPIRITQDPSSGITVVTDGAHRLAAAEELGLEDIPVEVAHGGLPELVGTKDMPSLEPGGMEVVLDVVDLVPDKEDALRLGRERGQEGIFGLGGDGYIPVEAAAGPEAAAAAASSRTPLRFRLHEGQLVHEVVRRGDNKTINRWNEAFGLTGRKGARAARVVDFEDGVGVYEKDGRFAVMTQDENGFTPISNYASENEALETAQDIRESYLDAEVGDELADVRAQYYGSAGRGYGLDPALSEELRTRYPEVGKPVTKTNWINPDPFGQGPSGAALLGGGPLEGIKDIQRSIKRMLGGNAPFRYADPRKPTYLAKGKSPESDLLKAARDQIKADIEAGNYTPYFDEGARFDADLARYDVQGATSRPVLPATVERYRKQFDTPEIRERLKKAFRAGLGPDAENWYMMGQLEQEAMKLLGPAEGARWFDENFATAMAATTGGADPTANLLMAQYGNYRRARGLPADLAARDLPFPIGGRFVSGNMEMYESVLGSGGKTLEAGSQPKRYNFRGNFLGDPDRATIDEQMMSLFDPSGTLKAPPGDSYGIIEDVVKDVARELGVSPRFAQEVMWAGAKGIEGKPMIRHVNEAIERTARITNQTPEEVVRRWIVENAPLYGIGGLGLFELRKLVEERQRQQGGA